MGFLLFFLIGYILFSIALYQLFPAAGIDAKLALIPGYNLVVLCDLIGRPRWWALLLLLPIVNFFILAAMLIDTAYSFGQYGWGSAFLSVVAAPFYFLYLAYSKKPAYDGASVPREQAYRAELKAAMKQQDKRALRKLERSPYRKGMIREWGEAIIFAVFAAAFIRMFLFEAYVIPTPSMEGSMLVGDFLFVSKTAYGLRTPKTVAMIPLLHNRVPVLGGESYLEKPSLNPVRLPGFEKIDRYDQIVFNYPEGDSVYIFPGRTYSVYDYKRGSLPADKVRQIETGKKKLVTRPIDKMDHYIKRAIGMPGDSLQLIDRAVYINGSKIEHPPHVQFLYQINYPGNSLNTRKFSEWGIGQDDRIRADRNGPIRFLFLSDDQKEKVLGMDPNIRLEHADFSKLQGKGHVFPHDPAISSEWTVDNFGPIYIPKAGATVELNERALSFYGRIITAYEGNTLEVRDGQYIINGAPATTYTFKQDYYWGMGDNRHNSEDCRVWGYIPASHMVGKPSLIFFSNGENGIRWNRVLTRPSKY